MLDFTTLSWSVFVVAILLILSIYLLRFLQRKGVVPMSKSIALKDSFYLDTKNRFIVLEWKKKDYLLVQTPQGLTIVDQRHVED